MSCGHRIQLYGQGVVCAGGREGGVRGDSTRTLLTGFPQLCLRTWLRLVEEWVDGGVTRLQRRQLQSLNGLHCACNFNCQVPPEAE